MKFKQVNPENEVKVKKLLKKVGIPYRYFRDYGVVNYDHIEDESLVIMKKWNGQLDYPVGKIDGNAKQFFI